MKPQLVEKWKMTRQKGMLRFVLVYGVLSYGFAMFLAMTFLFNRDKLSASMIGISAVVWTIGGALFGVLVWLWQERQHRKAIGTAA